MRTFSRAVLALLFAVIALVPRAHAADTLYSYTGSPFVTVSGIYTTQDRITGSLILSDSFVPIVHGGPQDVSSGVLSWSFTDGHQTLTQDNSTGSFFFIESPTIDPVTLAQLEGVGGFEWFVRITTPTSTILTFRGTDREDMATIGADADCGGALGDPNRRPSVGNCARNTDGFNTNDFAPIGTWTVVSVLRVSIDIKPRSFPNSINRESEGNVPVALLSSATFDATTADRSTVMFAGASPLDVGQTQDVNGDGLLDVMFHFATQSLTLPDGTTEACLTGSTTGGTVFKGCDSVRLVK